MSFTIYLWNSSSQPQINPEKKYQRDHPMDKKTESKDTERTWEGQHN
jgi:hypothetical protein